MRSLAAVGIALLFVAVSTLAAAEDGHYAPTDGWPSVLGWTEYGGSLERTGRSPADGPASNVDAVAPVALGGRSFSAPVVDRFGHVYVGDVTGKVHRYTPDLKKVWSSAALGGPLRSSVLVGPDGTVFAAPANAHLAALDGRTGKVLWRLDIDNDAPASEFVVTGAPAWHPDGFVVQGSMDGNVYGIQPDGKKAWTFETASDVDNKVVSTAAIASDGTIYIGSQNGRLYALSPDGKQRWVFRTNDLTSAVPPCPEEQQVAAPSLDDDGTIYIGTRLKGCGSSGKVYAVTDEGGRANLKWSRNLADKVTAPVTVGTGQAVYVGALDGTFYALAKSDGAIRWDFRPQDDDPTLRDALGRVQGDSAVSIAVSAAELAVVDRDGTLFVPYWNVDFSQGFPPQDSLASPLYALDADGKIVWRKVFSNAPRSPALMPTTGATGTLYVAADDGKLHALGASTPIPPPRPDATEPPAPIVSRTGSGADPAATVDPADDTNESPWLPVHIVLVLLGLAVAAVRRP